MKGSSQATQAGMRAIRDRLEATERHFDQLEDHLSTYRNVQMLTEQMAELGATQQPSA